MLCSRKIVGILKLHQAGHRDAVLWKSQGYGFARAPSRHQRSFWIYRKFRPCVCERINSKLSVLSYGRNLGTKSLWQVVLAGSAEPLPVVVLLFAISGQTV